tara:strand:+ start:1090 stop:1308 length:219 start_codon:yes stop_codon:yes gene_type:complete
MDKLHKMVLAEDEIGWSTCDVCNKLGNFFDGYFYGFGGFTQTELNELGLFHLDANEDNVRCDDCLMITTNKE